MDMVSSQFQLAQNESQCMLAMQARKENVGLLSKILG